MLRGALGTGAVGAPLPGQVSVKLATCSELLRWSASLLSERYVHCMMYYTVAAMTLTRLPRHLRYVMPRMPLERNELMLRISGILSTG